MSSAQNISPNRAQLWLPFDGQYTVGGVRIARNVGGASGAPATVQMGDGMTASTFPSQRSSGRGLRLDGGDYVSVPLDFSVSVPFTIAVLTTSTLSTASWLTATYDSATARGVRFGTTGSSALVAGIYDDGGRSITATSASGYVSNNTKPRLFCLSYDGTGNSVGLVMSIDDVVARATLGGTQVTSSISSGRNLLLGARWNAAVVTEILPACSIFCAASYPVVLTSYEKRLLKARMMQEAGLL